MPLKYFLPGKLYDSNILQHKALLSYIVCLGLTFTAEHQKQQVGRLAAELLGCSTSLVPVPSVTEAQHSLLSVEVQRQNRSAVGSHHQLVVFVCDFMMFKTQRSFFLISKVTMQKTDLMKSWCTVSPCSVFISTSPTPTLPENHTLCRMPWEDGLFSFAGKFAAEHF